MGATIGRPTCTNALVGLAEPVAAGLERRRMTTRMRICKTVKAATAMGMDMN